MKNLLLFSILLCAVSISLFSQNDCYRVRCDRKISYYRGNFNGSMDIGDFFGKSVAPVGDLDNNGVNDIVVGLPGDDDGGNEVGSVYVLFMNSNGMVITEQKISAWQGNFTANLTNTENFGSAVCGLGDLDNDGVEDIAVGASGDNNDRGAVFILFMNSNGTVKSHQKISDGTGGFAGPLHSDNYFGSAITNLGDRDQDGVIDLAVGASGQNDLATRTGAVYILHMNSNGTVKSHQKISATSGGFTYPLGPEDFMGNAVTAIGDIDGDTITDIAVGAYEDDDGGLERGAVYILMLNANGTVKNQHKISFGTGGFGGVLDNGDHFGSSVANVGDINGDGTIDLLIGAEEDDDGGSNHGATWLLFMNPNGTVKQEIKISAFEGNFHGDLHGFFGQAAAGFGDYNNDGYPDIIIGSADVEGPPGTRGAVWIICIEQCPDTCVPGPQRIFQKTFTASAEDFGHAIQQTYDKGYVIAGVTESFGAGNKDWFLMRTDHKGDTLWTRTFGTAAINDGNPVHVVQTADSGFVMAGRVYHSTQAIHIIKLDKNGIIEWQKFYGGTNNELSRSIKQTADGGYIVAGTYSGTGFLLRLNADGTQRWAALMASLTATTLTDVEETADHQFIACGHQEGSSSIKPGFLLKVDSLGNEMWHKAFRRSGSNHLFTALEITPDHGYIITGMHERTNPLERRAFLIKTDSAGNHEWHKAYLRGTSHARGTSIKVTEDGGYIVGGYSLNGALPLTDKNLVFRTDDCGNVQWAKGLPGNEDAVIHYGDMLQRTHDGGFVFANHFEEDVHMIKMNNCGSCGCQEQNYTLSGTGTIADGIPLNYFYSPMPVLEIPATTFIHHFAVSDTVWCDFDPLCQLAADFTADTVCFGDSTHFRDMSIDPLANVNEWNWMFEAGVTVSGSPSPAYLFSSPGLHTVKLTVSNDDTVACSDQIEKNIYVKPLPAVALGNDSTLCYGEMLTLNAFVPSATYNWQDGSSTSSYAADTTGLYHVAVSLENCMEEDSIYLQFDLPPVLDIGNDSVLCLGDSLLLDATTTGFDYKWQDGSTMPAFLAKASGIYRVVINDTVCTVNDSVELIFEVIPLADLGPDTVLCTGDSLILNAFFPGSSYQWSTGSVDSVLLVRQPGLYQVELTSPLGACKTEDSIAIGYDPVPIIELGNDTSLCESGNIILDAFFPNASYQWNNMSTDPVLTVTSGGLYSVITTLGNCTYYDEINIHFDSLPMVSVNNSYEICSGEELFLRQNPVWVYQWSNGTESPFVAYSNPGKHWVVVRNGTCVLSDTFYLRVNSLPDTLVKNQFVICDNKPVMVDAGNEGAAYNWSTGEKDKIIYFNNPGTYYVNIVNEKGCNLRDTVHIDICNKIFIPNTITPNADGKNDSWIIRNIAAYPGNKAQIFNRNGYLLFETVNYQNDWNGTHNGKSLPAGVYYYVLDLGDKSDPYRGTITLLRQKE